MLFSDSHWICDNCQFTEKEVEVRKVVNACFNILVEKPSGNILEYEKCLESFKSKLHNNHYIVMTVKKFLADLYEDFDIENMPKKIQYYQEFLDVMSKVDPGYPKVHFNIQWRPNDFVW